MFNNKVFCREHTINIRSVMEIAALPGHDFPKFNYITSFL